MFSKQRRYEVRFHKRSQRELLQLCRGGDHPFLPLYTPEEIARRRSKAQVHIVPFFLNEKAPVVLCCPGGAYAGISWLNEGYQIATALNAHGFSVLLLGYRTGIAAENPNAPQDVAAAMRWLQTHAAQHALDMEHCFLMGFSAGGHLAAYYAATAANNGWFRPNGVVLGYPVISMEQDTHLRSRHFFLGKKERSLAAQKAASVEQIADATMPPVFTFHCEDDTVVPPSNSLRLTARLEAVGVPCELRLYPTGGHGVGLGVGTSAEGWLDEAVKFMQNQLTVDS